MVVQHPVVHDIIPHLGNYARRISAAGITLGSILYLGFGLPRKVRTSRGTLIDEYPALLEFGADKWHLNDAGQEVIDSDFSDINTARVLLKKTLSGRKVTSIELSEASSKVRFDLGGSITSYLSEDPASGFLYHFRADDGPCWDTVDGRRPIDAMPRPIGT